MAKHPVWDVYHLLRTAVLNEKYYTRIITSLSKWDTIFDIIIAVSAPTSAIAGFAFWETDLGSNVWKIFAIITAIVGTIRPFLKLSKKIKENEKTLMGYRGLRNDLEEIRMQISQGQTYSKSMQKDFSKARKKKERLIEEAPIAKEKKRLKRELTNEVKKELPPKSFFIPKD